MMKEVLQIAASQTLEKTIAACSIVAWQKCQSS